MTKAKLLKVSTLVKRGRGEVRNRCAQVANNELACAVRELREETGYHGVATLTSPIMFNDPGFCNTNLRMVHVTVDLEKFENRLENLKPELEESEFIETFTVPLANFWDELKRLESEGYKIDARVGTIAEGIEVAKKWKLC